MEVDLIQAIAHRIPNAKKAKWVPRIKSSAESTRPILQMPLRLLQDNNNNAVERNRLSFDMLIHFTIIWSLKIRKTRALEICHGEARSV
jgi:hypothetical protein